MTNFTARALQQIGVVDNDWQPIPNNLVYRALRNTNLPEYEYDPIAHRVVLACDTFLRDDLMSEALLIEASFENGIKGIFDLVRLNSNGTTRIVDWKTTGDVKRPNYADEIKEEFQTSFYLHFGSQALTQLNWPEIEYIEYRCIDEKDNILKVTKLNNPSVKYDALQQLDNLKRLYESQPREGAPWAMNRPRACFRGGQRGASCPFWNDCTNGTQPPTTQGIEWNTLIPRSKSAIKDFLHCPEQYRRIRILNDRDEMSSSREILIGEAFHACVASVWEACYAIHERLI